MKAKKFEQKFDEGVDITASLDFSKSKRVLQARKYAIKIAIVLRTTFHSR
jgi:hypothetical protein